MIHFKRLIKLLKHFQTERNISKNKHIKFFNFWKIDKPESVWFYQFIENRNILSSFPSSTISFFSVYGNKLLFSIDRSTIKIFFTGENVHRSMYRAYEDYCLSNVDLSLGFEYFENENYLRFPLWLLYFLEPDANYFSLKRKIETISVINFNEQMLLRKFCSLVASHDENGIRSRMYTSINNIDKVDSAGKLLQNTDVLQKQFNNAKIPFLANYKFNICPENSNNSGYVTEKLFEALFGNCIPIYWGSDNNPEPAILNKEAILFWNDTDNNQNENLLNRISEIHKNRSVYKDFVSQERFLPHAAEYIWEFSNLLEMKLRKALTMKK